MPSGFQQDINQLSPDFYRVVITMSGGTGTWSAARHNPSYGTNYCRFYNTIGSEWGNGTYYFVLNLSLIHI